MRFTLAGLVIFLGLAAATPALAQKTYMLGVSGGVALPVNKLSDDHGTGSTFMVSLAMGVENVPVGLRIDGTFNNFGGSSVGAGVGAYDGADVKINAAIANLIVTFSGSRAKPYLIGGAGLYSVKPDLPDADSKNHSGLNIGAGTTFGLSRFSAFLEARYHSVSRKKVEGGRLAFVPVTLGFFF